MSRRHGIWNDAAGVPSFCEDVREDIGYRDATVSIKIVERSSFGYLAYQEQKTLRCGPRCGCGGETDLARM